MTTLLSSADVHSDDERLGHRSVRGTIWTVIGNGLSQIILLASHMLCARLLGRADYGKFGAVTGTTAMVGLFAGLGLSLTATKYLAELRHTDLIRAKRVLVLAQRMTLGSGLLMAAALASASGYLASAAFAAPDLRFPLQISAATILFTAVSTLQTAVLSAFERFRESSELSVLRAGISLPAMIIGSRYLGVAGAAAGLLAGTAAACLFGRFMVRRCLVAEGLSFKVSSVWQENKVFWSFSLPSLLGGILGSGGAWVMNVILVRSSATFEGMGVLNASRQWVGALTFLPVAISTGSIPVLCSVARHLSDRDVLRSAFRVPNLLVQTSIWPVTLALLLLSPEVLRAYGPNFQDGVSTFVWLVGGTAIGYIGYACSLVVQARGLMWFGFTQQVVYTVVSVTAGYLLCPSKGPLGIALGVVAGQIALLLWMLVVLVVRYSFPLDVAFRIIRGSGLMLFFVLILSSLLLKISAPLRIAGALISLSALFWQSWRIPELKHAVVSRIRGWA